MEQWHVAVGQGRHGPTTQEQLLEWIRQGVVKGHDLVWKPGMTAWMPAAAVPELAAMFPAAAPPIPPPVTGIRQAFTGLAPHRGVTILVLGILGVVLGILGLIPAMIAYGMAGKDLGKMDQGHMDPTGRGMTTAGRVLGLVGGLLVALYAVIVVLAIMAH